MKLKARAVARAFSFANATIAFIMNEIDISDIAELQTVAAAVLQEMMNLPKEGACVIALHGDLGAGKTTFTQTLAQALGVTEDVTSPTFVIMKSYDLVDQVFAQLIHIDAYRIEGIDEMRVLGFETLLQKKDSIMCIEWAENIVALLPENTVHVHFTLQGSQRSVTITHGNN